MIMKEPVSHEKYGKGFAIKKRYNGFEKLVHFSNGVQKWIKRNELKPYNYLENGGEDSNSSNISNECDDANQKPKTIPPEKIIPHKSSPSTVLDELNNKSNFDYINQKSKEALQSTNRNQNLPRDKPNDIERNRFSYRAIIESLRLGGVPYSNIEKFTFGRDNEIDKINKWLESDEGSLILSGNYGVGKSHLLEVIASIAVEKGWAVSRVEIDPNETPFHKPSNIYKNITKNFSCKHNEKYLDFNEFIECIVKSKNSANKAKLLKHPYLGELLRYWNYADKTKLLDWIRGEDNTPYKIPKLFDEQTASNLYCNIISGIGWATKNILGLKGTLVLFDESESVDPFWYTRYQFEKARTFLRGSILMSNNDKRLLNDAGTVYSEKLNLRYSGRKNYRYPFLWEKKSHTKLIFSFVPDMMEIVENYPDIYNLFANMEKIEIDVLDKNSLQNIYERISDIYEEAYSFSIHNDFFHYIPNSKTRKFVKGVVEGLDLLRFNPDKPLDELLVNYD